MEFLIGFITTASVVLIIGGIVWLINRSLKKRRINYTLSDSTLVLKSSFGGYIVRDNIASVELVNDIPSVRWRSFGQSFLWQKEGTFTTSDGESVEIFNFAKAGPVICLTRQKGDRVFIRFSEEAATTELYNKLKK